MPNSHRWIYGSRNISSPCCWVIASNRRAGASAILPPDHQQQPRKRTRTSPLSPNTPHVGLPIPTASTPPSCKPSPTAPKTSNRCDSNFRMCYVVTLPNVESRKKCLFSSRCKPFSLLVRQAPAWHFIDRIHSILLPSWSLAHQLGCYEIHSPTKFERKPENTPKSHRICVLLKSIMVLLVVQDGERPVNLLDQDQPDHLVGHGETGEAQAPCRISRVTSSDIPYTPPITNCIFSCFDSTSASLGLVISLPCSSSATVKPGSISLQDLLRLGLLDDLDGVRLAQRLIGCRDPVDLRERLEPLHVFVDAVLDE